MYCTTKQMLLDAQRGGYAVGAFNAENMEMAMAIVAAAEELGAPVLIQTTPSTVRYAGLTLYSANVRALAERASVPVALHLDHGSSFELARDAIAAGYSSVMIDGSHEGFEENIALSRRVAETAHAKNIPVEAELGKVGGKEDDLDAETRRALDAAGLSLPLVLHGASGLSDRSIRDCVREGICKVNFATELRVAYTEGVREVLADPAVYDPKKYGALGMKKVTELVKERMAVCGCAGKAVAK